MLEAYWEPSQSSKKEFFAEIFNGWKPLTIVAKSSILDVWQVSEYASACTMKTLITWPLTAYCWISEFGESAINARSLSNTPVLWINYKDKGKDKDKGNN